MEKAFRLATSPKPGTSHRRHLGPSQLPATDATEEALADFDRELQALSKTTETFAATLPALVPSGDINVHALRNQILAHTLVRMAFVHLNVKSAANDASVNARCVEAAIAMVKLFDDVDLVRLEMLPPIMAVSAVILLTG